MAVLWGTEDKMAIISAKTLVDQAKAQVRSLTLTQTQKLLAEDSALLIDIRDVRELQKLGKIPGAVHAPRGMLEFWADPQSPYHRAEFATDKTLVLYCASAWRSALAAKTLQDMGFDNVAELEGGFSAWVEAGLQTEPK